MRLHPRLMLIFRCEMTQTALDRIRSTLRLTASGRLTDHEDAEFGHRYLSDSGGATRPTMELWRGSEIWSLEILATDELPFTEAQLAAWQAEMAHAVSEIGGTVEEVRTYEDRNERARRFAHDRVRNEDWLRAMSWSLPARTLDELFGDLGVGPGATDEQRRARLAEFVASPTWEPAPDPLKREAEEFLRRSR